MTALQMQRIVKEDLGISHCKKDADICEAIETAEQRLSQIGVDIVNSDDATTRTAIKLYCRAWFNFQGEGERYKAAFEGLANSMAQAKEYRRASV